MYHTLHNVYTDQVMLVLYASNTRVNADIPGVYKKISFSRLLPQTTWLMPDEHASTKMCFKVITNEFSVFISCPSTINSHIQCETVKCMSLDLQFAVRFLCRIYLRGWKVHYTWTYVCVYIYIYTHTHTHVFCRYVCVCVCVCARARARVCVHRVSWVECAKLRDNVP